ncbi:ABC transporter substrate-binding protein [Megasphaera sueciensis]|jgi:peptide/nickel transport system substrate-binding protein|uniref:ABC transporter substrate-binding protein n=1 Tax=Megasphaera sueciensis TaxID=349094 RepID=UPI003CFEF460
MKIKWKKSYFFVIAIFMMVAMFCSGCGGNQSEQESSNEKIIMARANDSKTLDPMMAVHNDDLWMMNLVTEGLVKADKSGKKIEPCLADKWTVSADGLTYTFSLKPDVKFSDGEKVTAADWIYSLTRIRDTKSGSWQFTMKNVKDITSPNEDTLVITLEKPSSAFLSYLCLPANTVMPKKYCEQAGNDGIAQKPIGTGPYMLKEWDKGQKMIFVKNPNYHEKDKPISNEIDINVVPDDNTRIMQLQGKQIDIASDIPFSRVEELKQTQGIKMDMIPSTEADYISFNYKNPKFADIRVRQALAYGVDRQSIIDAVFFGHAKIANTFISPSAPHFDGNITSRDYNPEKAKQLLSEAGATNLSIDFLVASGNTRDMQVATMLKEQWGKIGVNVNIEQVDSSVFKDRRNSLNYDMLLSLLTSDITDTSELMDLMCVSNMSDSQHTGWNGEKQLEAQKLVMNADLSTTDAERSKLYGQSMQLIQDDQLIIPLYYVPFAVAMNDQVKDFVQTPLGNYYFENLSK